MCIEKGLMTVPGVKDASERLVRPKTSDVTRGYTRHGLLIRINNPEKYVFAYVPALGDERRFDPTRDVCIKSPAEERFHG
jgi:hypothetical protein